MRRIKPTKLLNDSAIGIANMSMGSCCLVIFHQPKVPQQLLDGQK